MNGALVEVGSFVVEHSQKARFATGQLCREWQQRYPQLFDADDVRLASSQPQYHFYEWLAAILIFETTGWLSLIEQYEFQAHAQKQAVIQQLASASLQQILSHHKKAGQGQLPDLLSYRSDYSDWYFCEVKGPTDKLRTGQAEYFAQLATMSGQPVRLIRFRQPSYRNREDSIQIQGRIEVE